MITGAAATSRIRIIPERADAIALTAERAATFPANIQCVGSKLPAQGNGLFMKQPFGSTTLNVYAHTSEKMVEDTAARMQDYYSNLDKMA